MTNEPQSLFQAIRHRLSRRGSVNAEGFKEASEGLVDWMRGADVKIGYMDLILDDEPFVVLIGRSERAADLKAAYEALNVAVVYAESFDPPLKVKP